jgi:hypothetical protein
MDRDLFESKPLADMWLHEAARRLTEIESGNVALIPAEDVLRQARDWLRRKVSARAPE